MPALSQRTPQSRHSSVVPTSENAALRVWPAFAVQPLPLSQGAPPPPGAGSKFRHLHPRFRGPDPETTSRPTEKRSASQGLAGIHFSEVRVFHRRGIARHLGAWMRRRGRARPGHDDVRRDAQVARTDFPHAPGPRAARRASEMSLVGAGSLAERSYAPSRCGAWLSKLKASPVNNATLVTFSRPRTRNWPRPSRLLK